jgi:hypothetical protein
MIIVVFLIWYIAGLLNGLMDSIQQHDSYANWGHFFSRDSWKDRYDNNHTFLEGTMQASINAWHIAKWLSVVLISISVGLFGYYCHPSITAPIGIPLLTLMLISLYGIGFRTSYR